MTDNTAITGAIFDCDGTLVDSMLMWNALVEQAFEDYDIPRTPELLAEAEAYNFDDMCFWFHERFGIGESCEAVLAEIRAKVQDQYRHVVQLFPSCRDFLDELHAAGVRMLILSATTAPEVRVALEAQGIADYFERIIQSSETGTDKEHPGAYRYALEALGTDKETTWVFEDAPFAVRTAHDDGFKTVCLHNDHDGRDVDFCRANCDILAHGYGELSLALLQDYARPARDTDGVMQALVVSGSPQPSSTALVARLAAESDYVIAADRGAQALREANVAPDMFCGDSDSIDAETLAWATEASGAQVIYPSEKYDTDLALAVACARHEAARRQQTLQLTITCAAGGRPDHTLGVYCQMLADKDVRPRLVEDGFECRILASTDAASWEVGKEQGAVGQTFSLVPLAPDTVVSETGMKWNLDHRTLPLLIGASETMSNIIESQDATVTCHAGALAAFTIQEP